MGVGAPRYGLQPGNGQRPGIDDDLAHAELRYIEFPSTTINPGRGLRTVLRWATVPSLTLYPATNRYLRGAPESFFRTLTMTGSGLMETVRGKFSRHRLLLLVGASEQRAAGIVHGPSFLLGKIPTVVSFSQPNLSVEFEAPVEAVEFETGAAVVEL